MLAVGQDNNSHLNFKKFTRSFAVTGGQDGGVAVDKPMLVEIVVDGPGSCVSHSEDTGEEAGLGSQVRELAHVVVRVLRTRLEWVVLRNRDLSHHIQFSEPMWRTTGSLSPSILSSLTCISTL